MSEVILINSRRKETLKIGMCWIKPCFRRWKWHRVSGRAQHIYCVHRYRVGSALQENFITNSAVIATVIEKHSKIIKHFHAFVYAYTNVCMHKCMYAYMYVCINAVCSVYVMYVSMYVCIHSFIS